MIPGTLAGLSTTALAATRMGIPGLRHVYSRRRSALGRLRAASANTGRSCWGGCGELMREIGANGAVDDNASTRLSKAQSQCGDMRPKVRFPFARLPRSRARDGGLDRRQSFSHHMEVRRMNAGCIAPAGAMRQLARRYTLHVMIGMPALLSSASTVALGAAQQPFANRG